MSGESWVSGLTLDQVKEAYRALSDQARGLILRGWGQWVNRLVIHVRANKLSGQVLGRRSSYLYRNYGAQSSGDGTEAKILEPLYGRAWERGEVGGVDIYPKHLTRDGALGWLRFPGKGGTWVFSQHVYLPKQPARPHTDPGIEEMRDMLHERVSLPLAMLIEERLSKAAPRWAQ
jgi:hypothetical protein